MKDNTNKKIAVRLNLDVKSIRMLEELSKKQANSSKSQATRKAIQDAHTREFSNTPNLSEM